MSNRRLNAIYTCISVYYNRQGSVSNLLQPMFYLCYTWFEEESMHVLLLKSFQNLLFITFLSLREISEKTTYLLALKKSFESKYDKRNAIKEYLKTYKNLLEIQSLIEIRKMREKKSFMQSSLLIHKLTI